MARILTMYDSAQPNLIPDNASCVAGYIDGSYKWASEYWTHWRGRPKVRISVGAPGNVLANVFDVENGGLSITEARDLVQQRADVYLPSVIYCSASNWGSFKSVVAGLPVGWWIADWITGQTPTEPMAGAVGWQYASFADYDVSVVDTSAWPGW